MSGGGDRRTAVVTGASQGIGREIALRLAADGMHVVLGARSRERLEQVRDEIHAVGGEATVVVSAVRDAGDMERLAAAAEAVSGAVDVAVANSGIAGPTAELWEADPDQWQDTIAVNLVGVFHLCRAVLPGMVRRRGGGVVVIGSGTGKRPMAGRTPYAASKLGLVGLVRSLALEAGRHDVRVNLVSPGPIEGERIDRVIALQAERSGTDPERMRERMAANSAMRRFTSARDVADAVAFLAGDAARSITGEDLNVSSGWVMY
jgi:NAD(P)-dependent dehydrogenase (short-subunit alcohol dehydrogenase family)